MTIPYDYYRIFYFVAKYGSFTKAAEILNNNQPNVTRCINILEHNLCCRLFIRSHSGASLTPEGERLFAHVSIAQGQLETAQLELANETNFKTGTITIAASETALHRLLLTELEKFHKRYPAVRIRLLNHSTPQAIAAVKNGAADIALVTTPCQVEKPLVQQNLLSFRETAVCGPEFATLSQKKMHLQAITSYPIVCLNSGTGTYEFYKQFFLEHGLDLMPDIEVATADQLLPIVSHNLGIAFIPEALAEKEVNAKHIFCIKLYETIPLRYICLIRDTSRPATVASEKFVSGLAASYIKKETK